MLGRTFPLHAALNGHQLAACIAEQHKQLHAKLERGESPRKTAVLLIPEQEPASTENSPVSADATPTDDVDTKRRKCHRCNRSRKEVSQPHTMYYGGEPCSEIVLHSRHSRAILYFLQIQTWCQVWAGRPGQMAGDHCTFNSVPRQYASKNVTRRMHAHTCASNSSSSMVNSFKCCMVTNWPKWHFLTLVDPRGLSCAYIQILDQTDTQQISAGANMYVQRVIGHLSRVLVQGGTYSCFT